MYINKSKRENVFLFPQGILRKFVVKSEIHFLPVFELVAGLPQLELYCIASHP